MRVHETGTYLDRILEQTARTVERAKHAIPERDLRELATSAPQTVDVAASLDKQNVGVIAEFKRASPSRGRFPVEIQPVDVVREYIEGGAAAISCLTDEPFFQGTLSDLDAAVEVASDRVPVLRKDFTIDPYQIVEARAHGASIILLIVATLDDHQLQDFRLQAEDLAMAALVEVHDEAEAERAVRSGARIIGINNRDLRSFETDLGTTERIAPQLPSDAIIVGESGISTAEDVKRMAKAGVDAVLVGESLIVQSDRATAVRQLSGVARA